MKWINTQQISVIVEVLVNLALALSKMFSQKCRSIAEKTEASFLLTLKDQTQIPIRFKQRVLRIHPTALNGRPVVLAIADILVSGTGIG